MSRNLVRSCSFMVIVASLNGVAGCSRLKLGGSSGPVVVRANNGHSQIELPNGWTTTTGLNDDADLQVHHSRRDISFVVLTEEKSAFADDMTYREHSDLTRKIILKTLASVTVSAPQEVTVGGRRAVRYRIDGVDKSNKVKVTLTHVTVDGLKHFHQLLFSTGTNRLQQNSADIEAILASFKDSP